MIKFLGSFTRSNRNEINESTKETTDKRSHMIIFNQEIFENSKERIGSSKDVKSLKDTFLKFGIDPIAKQSLRLKDIQKEIKKLSIKDFTGYKLFMCVLLTHGIENDIVSAKDKNFHLRETMTNPIIKNKTLNGVPKIFIIVACRGKGHSYFASDYLLEEDGYMLSSKDDVDYSNVLICYSTYEGHVSWRNTHFGTYYIMKLCTLIEEKGASTEFHLLLLELNNNLIEDGIQVAKFETSMRKQILLKDLLIPNEVGSLIGPKTIVMGGETGVGKSTLGNLILKVVNPKQDSPFKVMHGSRSSPMSDNVVATIRLADFKVNVIDTPGFGDTEGDQLNALNVCNIWKALEADNVVAVLFLFKSRFDKTTKSWYERLLKAIPEQHRENIFIVHSQYGGEDSDKDEDLFHIRRLSGNPNAKISHVLNSSRVEDHKIEILKLLTEWTSLPTFTVKSLIPPEIVYEKDEFGPIEHRFSEWVKDVKPRQELHHETKQSKGTGEGELEELHTTKLFEVIDHAEIQKEMWIEFRKKYRVRYDKTKDFVGEEIMSHYFKLLNNKNDNPGRILDISSD